MNIHDSRAELGPLLTITEEELARPARRREDRDILVLRVEIEAQRREAARLAALAGQRLRRDEPPEPSLDAASPDKLLLSAKDLRKALGVSAGTLYRWMKEDRFPPQIHIGSLARWNRAEASNKSNPAQAAKEARILLCVTRSYPAWLKRAMAPLSPDGIAITCDGDK